MKHWSRDYDYCKECHTTTTPHHGNGLCRTCYFKHYIHRTTTKDPLPPTPNANPDALEQFANALPDMLFRLTGTRLPVSYENGTVTIRKLGTKMSVSWPEP